MNTGKRRLEMVEGSSSKFWEVSIEGASFTVTYGRIGTSGTSKTTTTPSPEAAEKEVASLVREKLKKGYSEPGAGVSVFRPPVHIGTQTHLDRFLNYKVVGFNPEASADPDEDGRRELPALRELDKLVFAVGADYDTDADTFLSRLDALLADPKVGELRALLIGNWWGEVCEGAPTDVCERLIRSAPKLGSLKGLFLGEVTQEECEISWIQQGDCGPLLRALPQLEDVVIRGGEGLRFTDLTHENLRSLVVQTGGLSRETLHDIVDATLPNLRRLTLWLGSDNYGGNVTARDLESLLAGDRFPALEHLGLQDSEQADEIAAAVAGSPLLARLSGLDLSMGTLSDAGAEALLASPHVRSLAHLNLRYHYMSPAMTAKMRALGIDVNVSDRQEEEGEDDRYVEVSE